MKVVTYLKSLIRPLKQAVLRHRRGVRFLTVARAYAHEEEETARALNLPPLSKKERNAVLSKWKGFDVKGIGFGGHRVYKHLFGFDPEYVPFGFVYPSLLRVLTPVDATRVCSNKALLPIIFRSVQQPKCLGRRVNGCVQDTDFKNVTLDALGHKLKSYGKDFVIKAATDSCCGHGVVVVRVDRTEMKEVFSKFTGDFIVQELVLQSAQTEQFNVSSLNTFRITTLFLNNRFSLMTAFLRFGNPGSVVDNIGAGGGCVGVNDDGSLMPFGVNKYGQKIAAWNGVRFEGKCIEDFGKVVEEAKSAHAIIPQCAIIGWDFALDKFGDPRLIEVNLDAPGLFFEQLANARPAFRDRFDEVLEYVRAHPLPLSPMYDATN